MLGFKVKKIEKANKPNYVVVDVEYPSGKTYTFVRRAYPNTGGGIFTRSVIIEGFKLVFNSSFELISHSKEYETAGKKVTKTDSPYESIKKTLGVVETPTWKSKGEVFHEKFEMIKTCVESDIPVYLAGPAGSGKNHTLEQVAKALSLDFYFTNSVQQEYKLTGFIDAGGTFHETEFYKAFKDGGLFFLDEMDASIPEVLVLLNAAIANKYFEFPTGKITAHENFRVVSAGNTVGSGADEAYTGRMVLDQATLDRFAIIEFGYCLEIEMALAKGNTELVTFIRDLRKQAETKGIRATFSYRCISMVSKLEGTALQLDEIIKIAIVKGLDKDTLLTLETTSSNKYSQSLYKVKKAV